VKHRPKTAAATPAPEPSALDEPTPQEPAAGADPTLPDLPPPTEPQQAEAGAGSVEHVEAPGMMY
jgi:hypothetical protein